MTLSEGLHDFECVLREFSTEYCREEITVAAGQKLAAGTVVGALSSGGAIAVYNNGGSDGTQAAVGILLAAVDATDGAQKGVLLARGPVVVKGAALNWGTSNDAAKAAAKVDFAALNPPIIVRD